MGKNFTKSSGVLCIVTGGTTRKYFSLGRGTCHGDPISAFLFILALEIYLFLQN